MATNKTDQMLRLQLLSDWDNANPFISHFDSFIAVKNTLNPSMLTFSVDNQIVVFIDGQSI